MTRARNKKLNEALNRLIERISNSCLVQDTNLRKLNIRDSQYFANIIQTLNLNWSDLHDE